jgi:hypothetical protein
MTRVEWLRHRAAGLVVSAVVCGLTTSAFAGPQEYCDAYARDTANRKTGQGGDILVGTIGGEVSGALVGGILEEEAASVEQGAVIEGAGGTVTGTQTSDENWQRSYDQTFAACMDNYQAEAEPVEASDEPAPAKKSGKPKPGTKAWANYCASRYRSFDSDTGKYKSYSGEWRRCR